MVKFVVAIVEDDPRLHELLEKILREEGISAEIEHYYDPVSFVEALSSRQSRVELALLDVHFKGAGLTGVEALPFIREQRSDLPIILLTGMEGEAIDAAQDYECVYYIPKPIEPAQLVRMVRYYHGLGEKCGERIDEKDRALREYQELIGLLEEEMAAIQYQPVVSAGGVEGRAVERVVEMLQGLLNSFQLRDSFDSDLQQLYQHDFQVFRKVVESVLQLDRGESVPGQDIHKVKGAVDVFRVRVSHKIRLYFYRPERGERHLLRVDIHHDTKGMDRWLRVNRSSYAA
ncbi:MAG: response regulator [Gammaproteobacteria bacterium]|nr:response regulator [Gammaproteobacteria bacterium]